MAERRMFAKKITESDAFLEMPMTAQCLYFHLNMSADDDGFVNAPRKIMRMTGCGEDDMNVLIMKRFVLVFDSGVIVIKHWRINNYLRSDRYNPTTYLEEKAQLRLDENNAYTTADKGSGIPSGYHRETQYRLGKESKGKYRKGKSLREENPTYDSSQNPELDQQRLEELLERRKM